MRTDRNRVERIRVDCPALIVLCCLRVLIAAPAADGVTVLAQVASAEGEDYVAQRNRLLAVHPERWDVDAATANSWQAGLTAYMLNARLKEPAEFAHADGIEPEQDPAGLREDQYRRLRLTQPGKYAFLVEKAWKTARYPELRSQAVEELVWLGGWGACVDGPLPLWRAVWERSDVADLRLIAIHAIAWRESPDARDLVSAVLRRPDVPVEAKKAALTGLAASKPAHTREVLLPLLDEPGTEDELAAEILRILNRRDPDGTQPRLVDVVRDSARGPRARCMAVALLANHRRSEDAGVLAEAMAESSPPYLRRYAAHSARAYSVEQVREPLRRLARHTGPVEASADCDTHDQYEWLEAPEQNACGETAAVEAIRTLVKIGTIEDLSFVAHLMQDGAVSARVRTAARETLTMKKFQAPWAAKRQEKRSPSTRGGAVSD